MAIRGLGFGTYMAVDLALVADVLPDSADSARDMGLFNIANALPYALAPAVAPVILAASGDSYGVLYAVHIAPQGAGYTGTFEPFAVAKGWDVTDIVIGNDGVATFEIQLVDFTPPPLATDFQL